jgi:hypothetical protein
MFKIIANLYNNFVIVKTNISLSSVFHGSKKYDLPLVFFQL